MIKNRENQAQTISGLDQPALPRHKISAALIGDHLKSGNINLVARGNGMVITSAGRQAPYIPGIKEMQVVAGKILYINLDIIPGYIPETDLVAVRVPGD
jgi:hypothetical protein